MLASHLRPTFCVGLILGLLVVSLQGVQGEDELEPVPSEDLCRPYIEKALKDIGTGSSEQNNADATESGEESQEDEGPPLSDQANEEAIQEGATGESDSEVDIANVEDEENQGESDEPIASEASDEEVNANESQAEESGSEHSEDESLVQDESEVNDEQNEDGATTDGIEQSDGEATDTTPEEPEISDGETDKEPEAAEHSDGEPETTEDITGASTDDEGASEPGVTEPAGTDDEGESQEPSDTEGGQEVESDSENKESTEEVHSDGEESTTEDVKSDEESTTQESDIKGDESALSDGEQTEDEVKPDSEESPKSDSEETPEEPIKTDGEESDSDDSKSRPKRGVDDEPSEGEESTQQPDGESEPDSEEGDMGELTDSEQSPEEELSSNEITRPDVLRPREHVGQLLKLDEENEEKERAIEKASDIVLRELKRLYDNAIKPLETLYKYRDLSNRHFGDPEIFSKPLVLFMGPWSGGKSSIINYLLDIEYEQLALRTGAEPSPAYFNILMYGEEEEALDGTQLAADWTFSGLQKFGQGMLDRLRGLKLKSKLLEKVNIVEIPGILEIRKQVQRLFPFNDACQWFIDRADIIFLVYDPSKLDVGPETEAILDQLKGREYQTRIVLNKADQVKPEELMRVQGALIWNISPLMSSAEPPIMYSTSLWSLPYEAGAPTRLLYAQERALLRDLRSAIDKRVEHKIASARRFAVRVRNHAKMVDCYLTTYYNHKTFFGNKKEVSDKIIENPQDYHIYEGLSTLTNISRYDLPDPDVYKDFFRLNSLYDFQQLSSTCTYFRGCPINRLDIAIAYDLPELVGNYKKSVEATMQKGQTTSNPRS